jgi:hypothetical protein
VKHDTQLLQEVRYLNGKISIEKPGNTILVAGSIICNAISV